MNCGHLGSSSSDLSFLRCAFVVVEIHIRVFVPDILRRPAVPTPKAQLPHRERHLPGNGRAGGAAQSSRAQLRLLSHWGIGEAGEEAAGLVCKTAS